MKCTTIILAALAAFVSATPLTWQQKCDKYRCLTLDTVENWNPECARSCFENNIGKDGCAADDFRCHCKKAGSIAPIMRECLSNSTMGGCSPRDLGTIGAAMNEMCAYFNMTGYEAYRDCNKLLYSFVTFADSQQGSRNQSVGGAPGRY